MSDENKVEAVAKEKNSLEKLFDQLKERREKEFAIPLKPIKDKYNKLAVQIAPLEAAQRELIMQMKKYQTPEYVELDKQISQIARALGAKSVQAESA